MTTSATGPTSWVQLLQALVAREGVEQLGLSSRRIAQLLGTAPSAVSQYLSGKRQGSSLLRFTGDEEARRIARRTIDRLLDSGSSPARRTRVLLEGAMALAELSEGVRRPSPALVDAVSRPSTEVDPREARQLSQWLRNRVKAEQVAVGESMRLAQHARDDLTRAILRQIASDSLRHAEIVASLAPYAEKGLLMTHASGITPKDVRDLIRKEEEAESQEEASLVSRLGGTMALLLESMEADERKHTQLLNGLLQGSFETEDLAGPEGSPSTTAAASTPAKRPRSVP